VVVKNSKVIEGGFYDEGELEGFGFKRTFNPNYY
jgi:hypothetical protein